MSVGRQRLASTWTVVTHGSQLAAPGTQAVRELGLCVHELPPRRHSERCETTTSVVHHRTYALMQEPISDALQVISDEVARPRVEVEIRPLLEGWPL